MSEQRPPVKEFFSRTVTWYPALASRAAVAMPPAPAPADFVSSHSRVLDICPTNDNGGLLLLFSHYAQLY